VSAEELGVDQFVHDDLVEVLALLGCGNALLDAGGLQGVAVDGLPSDSGCRERLCV